MCVNLACVRIKVNESERFRIDSGVMQGCIMSSWLFIVYMNAAMKEGKMWIGRKRVGFMEEGREGGLPGLLYADELVLCGERLESYNWTVF